jgi:AhpD family alkylhydroperoxidase
MQQRLSIKDLEPNAYKGLLELEKYLAMSGLPVLTKELIKIRASQINGCAYCIELHTTAARKAGETEQRIYALSAWHESPLFTEEEKVLFAITDEITLISKRGLTDKTFEEAKEIFRRKYHRTNHYAGNYYQRLEPRCSFNTYVSSTLSQIKN